MKQVDTHTIKVTDNVALLIYSASAPMFETTEADDAIAPYESRWQLQEGKEYDYEILEDGHGTDNWTLVGTPSIFVAHPKYKNRGRIRTGIYVGTVNFIVRDESAAVDYKLKIEVQSYKTTYRDDYQKMLEDIAGYYTDLVMQLGSPITQTFDVDYNLSSETLYQKFSFVKSIIDSQPFDEAVHKVIYSPVRKWTETTAEKRIESVGRLSRSSVRQIASRGNRVALKDDVAGLTSLPRTLSVAQKVDTVDNHENQFVKYVLTTFYDFCSNLSVIPGPLELESLRIESAALSEKIAGYLNHAFFKDVSNPTRLNIGSPVLQRREGYREILQAWLMFDLAAKLTWKGGECVYEAGKKNIAALYEYWLFFKLIEVVGDVFKITPGSKRNLVGLDDKTLQLDLKIKQGSESIIEGTYESGPRLLNVQLCYNRTFSYQKDYKKCGSWTLAMRPDYTLSIWPARLDQWEAEEENAIVHIHFDAKYRLETILLDDAGRNEETIENELKAEKNDRQINIYKRGDLLKMHAYKDAIRRTAGAYVLYPGKPVSKWEMKRGFHEIIPGLGAFCIAPGHEDSQIPELRMFIQNVVDHFMDRTSKREKVSVAKKVIYDERSIPFRDSFPEPEEYMFPDTTPVLIACYKSNAHLDWIKRNRKYNIRLGGTRAGAIKLNSPMVNAQYLLLYDYNTLGNEKLYKIIGDSPQICTTQDMRRMGYPSPTKDQLYLVFDVCSESVEVELAVHEWKARHLVSGKGSPVLVNYVDLFPPK